MKNMQTHITAGTRRNMNRGVTERIRRNIKNEVHMLAIINTR